jgi:hypothetical protein
VDKQRQQNEEEKGFALVSLDESFFFYDSLVRRVFWIDEKKRPILRVTGSHKYPNMHFWSLESGGKAALQTVRWVQR